MKHFRLLILMLLVMSACKHPGTRGFEVVDYYGLEEIMQRRDKKTYVINFWASWCVPCIEELPHFEKLNQKYRAKNVKVILLSLDLPKNYETQLNHFLKNIASSQRFMPLMIWTQTIGFGDTVQKSV